MLDRKDAFFEKFDQGVNADNGGNQTQEEYGQPPVRE